MCINVRYSHCPGPERLVWGEQSREKEKDSKRGHFIVSIYVYMYIYTYRYSSSSKYLASIMYITQMCLSGRLAGGVGYVSICPCDVLTLSL